MENLITIEQERFEKSLSNVNRQGGDWMDRDVQDVKKKKIGWSEIWMREKPKTTAKRLSFMSGRLGRVLKKVE